MEKKELVDIDVRFLFVLLTTCIAIWIFLYDHIIVQTTNLETYYMIVIGLLHYTTFIKRCLGYKKMRGKISADNN